MTKVSYTTMPLIQSELKQCLDHGQWTDVTLESTADKYRVKVPHIKHKLNQPHLKVEIMMCDCLGS